MRRWTLGVVVALAVSFAGTSTAFAQGYGDGCDPHYGYGIGYGGYGPSNWSFGYRDYGGRYGGYSAGYRGRYWHDTSHWDYYGPSFQRHGRHYDYVPGHYHFHRSGHCH